MRIYTYKVCKNAHSFTKINENRKQKLKENFRLHNNEQLFNPKKRLSFFLIVFFAANKSRSLLTCTCSTDLRLAFFLPSLFMFIYPDRGVSAQQKFSSINVFLLFFRKLFFLASSSNLSVNLLPSLVFSYVPAYIKLPLSAHTFENTIFNSGFNLMFQDPVNLRRNPIFEAYRIVFKQSFNPLGL